MLREARARSARSRYLSLGKEARGSNRDEMIQRPSLQHGCVFFGGPAKKYGGSPLVANRRGAAFLWLL